jgi:DNA-binding LytR/AlgR family response regulator
MVSRVRDFLQQPFPSSNDLPSQIKESAMVGLFIFLFLFLFSPFNIDALPRSEGLRYCFYFGLVTFGVSLMYDVFLQKIMGVEFDKPQWTFGKWLISTIILILCISVANFLLMAFVLQFSNFSFEHFLIQLYSTFLVGIFPVAFSGAISLNSKYKKNEHLAADIQLNEAVPHKTKVLNLQTENDVVSIESQELIYTEALQNYVILYLRNNETITARVTLKSIEEQLIPSGYIRVHRSYIIDPDRVEDIRGNAQGLKLRLQGTDAIIPVSRSYIPVIQGLSRKKDA